MRPRTAQNTGRPPRPLRSSASYRDDDELTFERRSEISGAYTNSTGYDGSESNLEDYKDTDASGWMCFGMCVDNVNDKIADSKISDDTFDGENNIGDEINKVQQRQENAEEPKNEEKPKVGNWQNEKKDIEEFLKNMIDDIDLITLGDETLGDESLLTAETGINFDEETDYSVLRRIMYSGLCRIWPTNFSDECIPIISRDMMDIIDELDETAGEVTKEKVLLYLTQEADNKKANETHGPLAIKNVPEEEEQEKVEESISDSDKAKTPEETPEIFEGFEANDISYEKNRRIINSEEHQCTKTDDDNDEDSISDTSTLGEIERMRNEHKERCLASMVSWEDDYVLPHPPTSPILDDDDAKTVIDTSLPDLKSTSVETSVEDSMNDLIISSDYKKLYSDEAQVDVIDMAPIKDYEENDGCISSNRLAELMTQLDQANKSFDESMKVVNGQLTPKNVTPVKPRTTTDIMKDRARWEKTLRDVQRRRDCRVVNN